MSQQIIEIGISPDSIKAGGEKINENFTELYANMGVSGFSGKSGYSGTNGSNGSSGYSGTAGAVASSGYSGINGSSGYSGVLSMSQNFVRNGSHGQSLTVGILEEEVVSNGGNPYGISSIQIPANATVIAVSSYVIDDYTSGGGGNNGRTITDVKGTTSSTSFLQSAYNIITGLSDRGNKNCLYQNSAAQTITYTTSSTPNGVILVRITIYYISFTLPTS